MYYGVGSYGRIRRRSAFGGLWMIGVGALFLLANFQVVEWYRIDDWFRQYWPVLLIVAGLVHLVEAVWERK